MGTLSGWAPFSAATGVWMARVSKCRVMPPTVPDRGGAGYQRGTRRALLSAHASVPCVYSGCSMVLITLCPGLRQAQGQRKGRVMGISGGNPSRHESQQAFASGARHNWQAVARTGAVLAVLVSSTVGVVHLAQGQAKSLPSTTCGLVKCGVPIPPAATGGGR